MPTFRCARRSRARAATCGDWRRERPWLTPTDATLADDTVVDGVLGDRLRLKITSTGTFGSGSVISARAACRWSRRARLALAALAIFLILNAVTPFITPDPPWLSDVPVVFAIMMLLIIVGLLHRIQTEPHGGG
jgi:hypothetical protein